MDSFLWCHALYTESYQYRKLPIMESYILQKKAVRIKNISAYQHPVMTVKYSTQYMYVVTEGSYMNNCEQLLTSDNCGWNSWKQRGAEKLKKMREWQ